MKSFKEMKLKDQILATEMKLKGATFIDVAKAYEFDYKGSPRCIPHHLHREQQSVHAPHDDPQGTGSPGNQQIW